LIDNTADIYHLQPKKYLYKSDLSAGPQIGYIAEDVYEINKSFATYNEPNGPPVNINYNVISIFLVEEIKKLNNKINDLTMLVDEQQIAIHDIISNLK
jgi:hypothetical protein